MPLRFAAILLVSFVIISCAKKAPERAIVIAPEVKLSQEVLAPKIDPLVLPTKNALVDQLRSPDLLKELPKSTSNNIEAKKLSSSVVIKATDENSVEIGGTSISSSTDENKKQN
jgi:hypothetical protein